MRYADIGACTWASPLSGMCARVIHLNHASHGHSLPSFFVCEPMTLWSIGGPSEPATYKLCFGIRRLSNSHVGLKLVLWCTTLFCGLCIPHTIMRDVVAYICTYRNTVNRKGFTLSSDPDTFVNAFAVIIAFHLLLCVSGMREKVSRSFHAHHFICSFFWRREYQFTKKRLIINMKMFR